MTIGNTWSAADARSRVLDTVSSMLAYWDRDLRCGFANRAYERWFGVDPQSLVGTTLADLLGPELFALNKPYVDAALSGREQLFERVIATPGGVLRPCIARYTPTIIGDAVVGFVAEVTDVSQLHDVQQDLRRQIADRDRATALLHKSETALRQAQKLGRIGSWEWEVDTDITTWSEELYLIFECDPAWLPPSYAEHGALYTPQSWQALQQAVHRTLTTGKPYVLELEYILSNGSTGWVEARGQGERDEAGNIVLLRGTAQEISYRRESDQARDSEARLAEALRELEVERSRCRELELVLAQSRKTETLGILSASIAHDFNNVLAAVGGALHLLKITAVDERSQDFVERGMRGVDRATRLVRQLMDFARIRPAGTARIDPASYLAECKELLALSLDPSIAFEVDLKPGGLVDVDPAQLEIALINLLVNASDAMPKGGQVTLSIDVRDAGPERRRAGAGWVVISVRDSGAGMSPEVLRRVKEPFYTTKGPGVGTGLGLSMVDAFARQSNGYLDIDSQPNRGTVVSIFLPHDGGVQTAAPRGPPDPTPRAPERGIVLLVVDDDQMVLPVVSGYLRELDYEVMEASSGREAIEIARSNLALQLVITDVRMRDVDGLQLVARLKVIRPTLPVLLMTGYAPQSGLSREEALFKPFSQLDLANRVLAQLAPKPVLATRLAGRIRHPEVMKLYEAWSALRAGASLPSVSALAPCSTGARESLFIAEVLDTAPFTLQRIFVGQALASRLVNHPEGRLVVDDNDEAFAKMETAYRRCMRLRQPSHEYARMQLNDEVVEFERLLLPCEEHDGSRHHLVGVVIFTNLPAGGVIKSHE